MHMRSILGCKERLSKGCDPKPHPFLTLCWNRDISMMWMSYDTEIENIYSFIFILHGYHFYDINIRRLKISTFIALMYATWYFESSSRLILKNITYHRLIFVQNDTE